MPCYHPLEAWRGPILPSGKRSVVFKRGASTPALSIFPQKLPCGQCIGCRLDYSLDWAVRCVREASMHKENSFVTLTYGPLFLPSDQSLDIREWQLFIKRLRKWSSRKIRYYHAGEYGERYGRPHYHALIFGLDFPDKVLHSVTSAGSPIYTSQILSKLWGKGFCSIGEVTFESAAYVARYCMKKINGKAKEAIDARGLRHYDRLDEVTGEVHEVRPEYVTMSRRPGIAFSWYKKFKSDVYPHDYTVIRGGVKMPPPRYFDRLYEHEDPLDMKRVKLLRLKRCTKRDEVWNDCLKKFQMLDANRDERLVVMESCKRAKVKMLRRSMESGHD